MININKKNIIKLMEVVILIVCIVLVNNYTKPIICKKYQTKAETTPKHQVFTYEGETITGDNGEVLLEAGQKVFEGIYNREKGNIEIKLPNEKWILVTPSK